MMKRSILFLQLILVACLIASPTAAHAEYWHEPVDVTEWNLAAAPGYSLLYASGDERVHQGFGFRAMAGYHFAPNWSMELRGRFGIFGADVAGDQGIINQLSFSLAGRYTFDLDWIQPYLLAGLGWVRSEFDREAIVMETGHSMLLEAGGGVALRITEDFWVGLEALVSPQFLGNDYFANSVSAAALISFEAHL